MINAGRKVNANWNALEETRNLLEQVDRARRAAEQHLADNKEALAGT